MAKVQHIQHDVGYVTRERKDAPQNQKVLTEACRLLEEMLIEGRYGDVTLNLTVKDGILMNDMTVTYSRSVRCT